MEEIFPQQRRKDLGRRRFERENLQSPKGRKNFPRLGESREINRRDETLATIGAHASGPGKIDDRASDYVSILCRTMGDPAVLFGPFVCA